MEALKLIDPRDLSISLIPSERARASSINDLPLELLSLIFEFVRGRGGRGEYWDGSDLHHIGVIETAQSPVVNCHPPSFDLTFTLVCRHWHRVAISTLSLWISLRLASWPSWYFPPRLHTVLARSGNQLLDVDVHHYNAANRWILPHLNKQYTTLFCDLAPRLRRLSFSQSRLNWDAPWITTLSNLTTLELKDPSESIRPTWVQFSSILRSTPSLRKLALNSSSPLDVSHNLDKAPIPLPNLTDLVLVKETPECLSRLFRWLYIPALKSLSLRMLSGHSRSITQLLTELAGPATTPRGVERQSTLLSQLEQLRIAPLSHRDDANSLQMFYDGLYNLKLLQIPPEPKLLVSLLPYTPSGQDKASVRLPRLETLVLGRRLIHDSASATLIREIVAKRKEAGYPITALYGIIPRPREVDLLKENLEDISLFYRWFTDASFFV